MKADGWAVDAALWNELLSESYYNVGLRHMDWFMKAIDRVMAAYAKVYKLPDEQADIVRKDLTSFITKLLDGRLPEKPEKST
jgi:hypothetical protein